MHSNAPIRLAIKPGHPDQDELELGVSPEAAQALVEELEREGLNASQVFKFSIQDPASLAEYTVYIGAAAALAVERLASAISRWSHRHDGKAIEFHDNGQVKSVTGLAPDEVRALIDEARARQRVLDEQWHDMRAPRPRPTPRNPSDRPPSEP